jgi:hypothetical protein
MCDGGSGVSRHLGRTSVVSSILFKGIVWEEEISELVAVRYSKRRTVMFARKQRSQERVLGRRRHRQVLLLRRLRSPRRQNKSDTLLECEQGT